MSPMDPGIARLAAFKARLARVRRLTDRQLAELEGQPIPPMLGAFADFITTVEAQVEEAGAHVLATTEPGGGA